MVATTADGSPVTFAASGGCKVDAETGMVTIQRIGDCTITATAEVGGATAAESTKFAIEPARPKIQFGERRVRFQRNLNFDLGASSTPRIPLAYKVIHNDKGTDNDEYCAVRDGALVWTKLPTREDHAQMDAFCMVRVSAAETSDNYRAPDPVKALVHIDYPSWAISARDQTFDWSTDSKVDANGTYVIVKVIEDNGNALGISVNGTCGGGDTFDTKIPVDTRVYKVKAYLDPPTSGAYDCDLTASIEPGDLLQDAKGVSSVEFTVSVKP